MKFRGFLTFWLFVGVGLTLRSGQLQAQTDSVALARIIYLTPNLDSLTRHFAKLGLTGELERSSPFGLSREIIWLPSGERVDLESTGTLDTSDWRRRATALYGTHVSGISFIAYDIETTRRKLDRAAIAVSEIPGGFALAAPKPLDVTFVDKREQPPQRSALDSSTQLPRPSKLSRITWLILTASSNEQRQLRALFDALELRKLHEGCCDYWLVGPAEERVGIRFELPDAKLARGRSPSDSDWLSIEDGGVIFNY